MSILNPLWSIRRAVDKPKAGTNKFIEPTFNYPSKLVGVWSIEPIQGALYKITLSTPITLTGGTDTRELEFFFHHRIIKWVLFQVDSSGSPNTDAVTWAFNRMIGASWFTEFSYDNDQNSSIYIPVDDLNLQSPGEYYQISLAGTATNIVRVEAIIEVLR